MTKEKRNDDIQLDVLKVNRVEVIDSKGRSYVNYEAADVKISLQDEGKTLKIFLNDVE